MPPERIGSGQQAWLRIEELGPVGPKARRPEHRRYVSTSSKSFLCFGGRLRLSGITRVAAGAMPEARARRRASLPASNRFFLRFFTKPALQMISLMPDDAWST